MFMNKSDLKLLIILISIIVLFFLLKYIYFSNNNYAYVYYENNLIKTIDLSINKEYKVDGYNGEVIIEVKDKKIRVKKETSPLHICSKQGYSNSIPIICLPNKIIIKLVNNDEYDAISK